MSKQENIQVSEEMISEGLRIYDDIRGAVSDHYLITEIYKAMQACLNETKAVERVPPPAPMPDIGGLVGGKR